MKRLTVILAAMAVLLSCEKEKKPVCRCNQEKKFYKNMSAYFTAYDTKTDHGNIAGITSPYNMNPVDWIAGYHWVLIQTGVDQNNDTLYNDSVNTHPWLTIALKWDDLNDETATFRKALEDCLDPCYP
jgi:hypothetical protein